MRSRQRKKKPKKASAHKICKWAVLSSDYYGIIWSFLEGKREYPKCENQKTKKGK